MNDLVILKTKREEINKLAKKSQINRQWIGASIAFMNIRKYKTDWHNTEFYASVFYLYSMRWLVSRRCIMQTKIICTFWVLDSQLSTIPTGLETPAHLSRNERRNGEVFPTTLWTYIHMMGMQSSLNVFMMCLNEACLSKVYWFLISGN